MLGLFHSPPAVRPDHSACSGCSLCVLVCPAWRATRDLSMSPEGRAKALQHGASLQEIMPSVEACTLCGACEPVCPENIDLLGMVEALRRQLSQPGPVLPTQKELAPGSNKSGPSTVLIPDAALRAQTGLLSRAAAMLLARIVGDDGGDLGRALETGGSIPPQRLEKFLAPLRSAKLLVVADGLLCRHLRNWLPGSRIASLGEALSNRPALRHKLRSTDLYVIEPRAYHSDHERLVKYYDALLRERGCASNLDLQRVAIPAAGRSLQQRLELTPANDRSQVEWILKGRRVSRVVVESLQDLAAFKQNCALPAIHLADLAHETDNGSANAAR